jgi:hypothetical protein
VCAVFLFMTGILKLILLVASLENDRLPTVDENGNNHQKMTTSKNENGFSRSIRLATRVSTPVLRSIQPRTTEQNVVPAQARDRANAIVLASRMQAGADTHIIAAATSSTFLYDNVDTLAGGVIDDATVVTDSRAVERGPYAEDAAVVESVTTWEDALSVLLPSCRATVVDAHATLGTETRDEAEHFALPAEGSSGTEMQVQPGAHTSTTITSADTNTTSTLEHTVGDSAVKSHPPSARLTNTMTASDTAAVNHPATDYVLAEYAPSITLDDAKLPSFVPDQAAVTSPNSPGDSQGHGQILKRHQSSRDLLTLRAGYASLCPPCSGSRPNGGKGRHASGGMVLTREKGVLEDVPDGFVLDGQQGIDDSAMNI